jgi:hypothetical protein
MAAVHGLYPDPPTWDGDGGKRGEGEWIVLPFAGNGVPKGAVNDRDRWRNFVKAHLERLPDRAYPSRLANLLHNFLLGVDDRHAGNAVSFILGDKGFVTPIDQGWVYRETAPSLGRYPYSMDDDLLSRIRSDLNVDGRGDQVRRLIEVYDDFVKRGEAFANLSPAEVDEWVETMMVSYGGKGAVEHQDNLYEWHGKYATQWRRLRDNREENLRLLVPDKFIRMI